MHHAIYFYAVLLLLCNELHPYCSFFEWQYKLFALEQRVPMLLVSRDFCMSMKTIAYAAYLYRYTGDCGCGSIKERLHIAPSQSSVPALPGECYQKGMEYMLCCTSYRILYCVPYSRQRVQSLSSEHRWRLQPLVRRCGMGWPGRCLGAGRLHVLDNAR